jgi:enterochelin esterase family protein
LYTTDKIYGHYESFLVRMKFIIGIIVTSLLHTAGSSQTFSQFTARLAGASGSEAKKRMLDEYLAGRSAPIVEDTLVYFFYRGKARAVAVPGELNQWTPAKATMTRVRNTDFFYYSDSFPLNGRVEYKLWVDSVWMLDPRNPLRAPGGYGENSEVRMPEYSSQNEDEVRPGVPPGRLDSLMFRSKILKRKHPVFVYVPRKVKAKQSLPVAYITDGGDYLEFGRMKSILDNLIADGHIRPLIGVFIDPRINLKDKSSNQRMTEYSASDSFLDFLELEIAPFIEKRYPASHDPADRLILGASMGGLISTYAVLRRPMFIRQCAAQSPAYKQADSAVFKILEKIQHVDANIYMQTGTINDTQVEARLVSRSLKEKGATLKFEEYPEGHNWTNWRMRLSKILEYFFPA